MILQCNSEYFGNSALKKLMFSWVKVGTFGNLLSLVYSRRLHRFSCPIAHKKKKATGLGRSIFRSGRIETSIGIGPRVVAIFTWWLYRLYMCCLILEVDILLKYYHKTLSLVQPVYFFIFIIIVELQQSGLIGYSYCRKTNSENTSWNVTEYWNIVYFVLLYKFHEHFLYSLFVC